ncbi:MAG: protein TolR [bacterium (Candidatus Ratteibacteria) CG_4_10_14_3_um_filter_41_18]|uniref:Protein TolR n=3 Tax=Candidatus Ratteibacteria TaxID=2979319 RepID=A0A2M7YGR9_9BACT|nr:MAG: protein TolR [bacterium (Candidatus Ratteibacteria) CG_4_10_14_3_um_filter_41_18]PJA62164.1 MAG: protein TolR [bacterium (Candidatus Ratteibacteria) CG_4_9_14_3_um_filter_41_21]
MKLSQRYSQSLINQINVTNLVDVMLSLLIIFIIVAPVIQQGINVRLPAASAQKISVTKSIIVSISARGNYYLDNRHYQFPQLTERLQEISKKNPEVSIIVKADKDVTYAKVIKVLDAAREAGILKVGLATRKE